MTKSKELRNFPTLPVISNTENHDETSFDCHWKPVLFIAFSGVLWFSFGVWLTVSLFMPKLVFVALIIIASASLITSGVLYYFYIVNRIVKHESKRWSVPVKIDDEMPLLTYRKPAELENTSSSHSKDFESSDSDVINLIGGLFASQRKPQLPPSTQE